MLVLSLATLSSCLFYILATYLHDRGWVRHIETGYGILFLVDYVLTVVAAPVNVLSMHARAVCFLFFLPFHRA